jgi:hypothetical protein
MIIALTIYALIGLAVYITTWRLTHDTKLWKCIFANLALTCYNLLVVMGVEAWRLILQSSH